MRAAGWSGIAAPTPEQRAFPIAATWTADSKDASGLAHDIAAAIREAESAAYLRGQQDMRERAAQVLGDRAKAHAETSLMLDSKGLMEGAITFHHRSGEAELASKDIRALATEETSRG